MNNLNTYIRDSLARLEAIERAVFEQRAELYKLKNIIQNETEYKIANFNTIYLYGVDGAYDHSTDD